MSLQKLALDAENTADRNESSVAFNWGDPELDIIPEQPETAVYLNPRGQLVIRQRRETFGDDPFVFFDLDRVPRLIDLIKEVFEDA
jgi:hypothetical protein